MPVESTLHGSALLYRLLESYPPDRLMVIEDGSAPSQPGRRVRGVPYRTLASGGSRLRTTRLHAWWSLWQSLRSASWAGEVPGLLGGFSPEAVLTVAHGHRWVTAAEFARRRRLPLHLIVHDDWPRVATLPPPFANRVNLQFGSIYRAAASRLCVSPWMEADYRQRYGPHGQVLYPSRSREVPVYAAPPDRLRRSDSGLTIAFAGSLNVPDYFRILGAVAQVLQTLGGRVLVFGSTDAKQAALGGLSMANVQFRGRLSSRELMERLREEVDVLLVPMSFAPGDAGPVQLSFPSKLTDYTAVGLPLLITGPAHSSAVRWAREHPGVAEVVDVADFDSLAAAVGRLAGDTDYRVRLAARALEVGARMFSHETAWNLLTEVLTGPSSRPEMRH
ncbi:MAG: hypothetical protein Q8T13_15145 [Acidobacteriota bacterium]|nr:hypothetical protein [Acidobacteriota bacterium]